MIRSFVLFLFMVSVFSSCKTSQSETEEQSETIDNQDSTTTKTPLTLVMGDTTQFENALEGNYQIYYLVIADTGMRYAPLQASMFQLHTELDMTIDTMERTYYPEKDLIALPEDHEDEIYAGDYFPRRSPGNTLSLEYLSTFSKKSNEKTIALVAGIYDDLQEAEEAAKPIKKLMTNTFILKANVYIGCMH